MDLPGKRIDVVVELKKTFRHFTERTVATYYCYRIHTAFQCFTSSDCGVARGFSFVEVVMDVRLIELPFDDGPRTSRFCSGVVDDDESRHVPGHYR